MSALLLFLLQLLQSAGFPVNAQTGTLTMGHASAPHTQRGHTTFRSDGSDDLDPKDELLDDPCDISNGF